MMKKNIALTFFSSAFCFCAINLTHASGFVITSIPAPDAEIELFSPEAPDRFIASAPNADDQAKVKLTNAFSSRQLSTFFSFQKGVKEAFDSYMQVVDNNAVSPDLRVQAKVFAASLYPYANTEDQSNTAIIQRRMEVQSMLNNIVEETTYSADMRAWTRVFLAKLFAYRWFDVDVTEAVTQSKAHLDAVIADTTISNDSRARARSAYADLYLKKFYTEPNYTDAQEKAKKFLNDTIADPQVHAEIKGDARILLVSISNDDTDPYHMSKMTEFKTLMNDESLSPKVRAKAKAKLARGLMKGEFDSKPSEAIVLASTLFKDIANDSKLDTMQRKEYKLELANLYRRNAFNLRMKESTDQAFNMYKEMIADANLKASKKLVVKWYLLQGYMENKFAPADGKDLPTTITDLFQEIVNNTEATPEILFAVRFNYARMYRFPQSFKLLGVTSSRAKSIAIDVLSEITNDSKMTGKQKEMAQIELEFWNGRRS